MKNKHLDKLFTRIKTFFSCIKRFIYNLMYAICPILRSLIKKPIVKDNTFIVWEPCSKAHSEVVPGYVKYLLDLGYHVSVLVEPQHIKDGLFVQFDNQNITLNALEQKQIKHFFRYGDLSKLKGILVTTVGKLSDNVHYEQAYEFFNLSIDKSKLFFVEHDIKESVDNGTWSKNIITLREMNYKNCETTAINPHYFGEVNITSKNLDITNFITIGDIKPRKKNSETIINAVQELHQRGFRNFKVTVIGNGKLVGVPKEIQSYFDIKGRLSFSDMFKEISCSDYFLTSYDYENSSHKLYITTSTSGNFQLIYGFLKPCLILKSFAEINGFDNNNSILYESQQDYSKAMEDAINMSSEDYNKLQLNLKSYVDMLYKKSLENLKGLIND